MPWSNQVQNQVIIAGTIPGLLTYSPTIGFGNLIASISASNTTDPSGNAVLSGEVGYTHVGGTYYAVQNGGSGTSALTGYYTAPSAAGPWTLQATVSLVGTTELQISSQNGGVLLAPGGSAGTADLVTSAGIAGGIPVSQFNRTPLSVGNSAAATDITNTWTINAHDADNGAVYTIETFVTMTTGPTTIETFTLGADIDGGFTLVPLATLGTAFNGGALSTTYGIHVRLKLIPGAGTGGDAQITLEGSLGDTSVNRLATNSANLSGFSNTTPYSTGFTHSIALYAQWGGTGGVGQSAGTNYSEFTRSGQD